MEAPATREAEGLFRDATAGLLDLRHRVIEGPRVEDHQGTSGPDVFVLAKAPDFATRPLDAGVVRTVVNTTLGRPTIFCAKSCSGLSFWVTTCSQYLMNPSVILRPSKMVSLVSVRWLMKARSPASMSNVIQSSWPSGPAT